MYAFARRDAAAGARDDRAHVHVPARGLGCNLLGNMWYPGIFGDNVEDRLGRVRFTLFYLAGGVASAMLHVALNPWSEIPTVGASGAIAASAPTRCCSARARRDADPDLLLPDRRAARAARAGTVVRLPVLLGHVRARLGPAVASRGGRTSAASVFGMIAITMLRRQARRSEARVEAETPRRSVLAVRPRPVQRLREHALERQFAPSA